MFTRRLSVIDRFLEVADHVLIGGAMCFPFFAAEGHSVGASLCEEEGIEPARRVLGDDKLGLPDVIFTSITTMAPAAVAA